MPTARFLDVFAEDSWRRVYAGEREVRPPGAPTTGSAAAARELLPDQPRGLGEEVIGVTELLNRGSPAVDRCGGCGLGVAMEEGDLRSQHVGEACSAFVDVVNGHRCCGTIRPAVPYERPRARPERAQWRLPLGRRAGTGHGRRRRVARVDARRS